MINEAGSLCSSDSLEEENEIEESSRTNGGTGTVLNIWFIYIKQLLDEVFVISGIIKVEVSVISRSRRLRLIILTKSCNTNTNHALRAQPTDYLLIWRYRLVNNLQVALFSRINCRLLANEKTDGDYNV